MENKCMWYLDKYWYLNLNVSAQHKETMHCNLPVSE
jgi:hypothetical protein